MQYLHACLPAVFITNRTGNLGGGRRCVVAAPRIQKNPTQEPKIIASCWKLTGHMAITHPDAGPSVSDLLAAAAPIDVKNRVCKTLLRSCGLNGQSHWVRYPITSLSRACTSSMKTSRDARRSSPVHRALAFPSPCTTTILPA